MKMKSLTSVCASRHITFTAVIMHTLEYPRSQETGADICEVTRSISPLGAGRLPTSGYEYVRSSSLEKVNVDVMGIR